MTSPRRDYHAERYYGRKERQQCTTCAATLQEDDGSQCVECTAANVVYRKRYRTGPKGRAASIRHHDRKRAQRIAAGQCTRCGVAALSTRPDGKPGRMCTACAAEHLEIAKGSKARKRAGVTTLVTERKRIALLRPRDHVGYVALDERLAKPRARILRAMRFLEWTVSAEIITLAGAPAHVSVERNTYNVTILRLKREGFVEARRVRYRGRGNAMHEAAEYQLTAAGRELARKAA